MLNIDDYRRQGNGDNSNPYDTIRELKAMLENQRRATEDALKELYEERQRRQTASKQLHNLKGVIQALISAIDFCFPDGAEPAEIVPDRAEWPVTLEAWMVRYARQAVADTRRARETGYL